jgi:hypothetical protein
LEAKSTVVKYEIHVSDTWNPILQHWNSTIIERGYHLFDDNALSVLDPIGKCVKCGRRLAEHLHWLDKLIQTEPGVQ